MGYQLSPEIDLLTRRMDEHAGELEALMMGGKSLPASAELCVQRAQDLRVTAKLVRNFLLISHGVEQRAPQICTLMGVRPDGTRADLGQIPLPPRMKLKEIMSQYFPGEAEDENSDLAMAIAAGMEFLDWLRGQGWQMTPAEPALAAQRT